MATPSTQALEKSLALLRLITADGGARPISALAAEQGLPPSTAYRIAATFERQGFVTRLRRGRYLAGPALLRLAASIRLDHVLAGVGRPVAEVLAKATGCSVHLGVLESDMVTYLLKAGRESGALFTQEGMQLEAYCTGIGKVLLAGLSEGERERYLAGGPFIRLTPNTLVDADALRRELASVKRQGFALDNAEMDSNLKCVAAPVHDGDGCVMAALSISTRDRRATAQDLVTRLPQLKAAAETLERRLFPG